MPMIIRNNIRYATGGGGNTDIVKLTQAEYDALPESKYSDGVLYAITDGESSSGSTSKPVELTKAQYEALGDSVLTDGILYAITDGDELNAKNMAYDDTETQLGVNNVQDAIIEQNKNLEQNYVRASTITIDIPEINGDSLKTIAFDAPRSFRMAQIIDSSGGMPYVIANMWYNHGEKKMYFIIANVSPISKPAKTVTVYYVY